jgi:hypothetical protein
MGVVKHGNSPAKQLKEKQAQADILRCFKRQVAHNPFDIDYQWVPSHQDDNKAWEELTLREQMNVTVDKLAKVGLIAGVTDDDYISSDFPFEQLRVSIDGKKVTGSLRSAFNQHWSHRTAREFFHERGIVSKYEFHLIWWDGVEKAMFGFPQMFRTFVTKQCSKFCGTNRQLARIDPTIANICPSCGQNDESSKHITRCKDPGRRAMLEHTVDELRTWMATTPTNPHLHNMIARYLLAQDSKPMVACVASHSPMLQSLAEVQDKLGWDNFVEGRISTCFVEAVRQDLEKHKARTTPERWCQTLVSKLLQLTHKQWLFRNSHVHYKKLEGLTAQQHEKIFDRVKELMWTDPSELLSKHKYLLEEDFQMLGETSSGQRQNWIASMESALAAAKHVRAGRETWGDPGTLEPLRHVGYTTDLRTNAGGNNTSNQHHVRGTRHLGGIE